MRIRIKVDRINDQECQHTNKEQSLTKQQQSNSITLLICNKTNKRSKKSSSKIEQQHKSTCLESRKVITMMDKIISIISETIE
jgi:hypothetical protein